MSLVFKDADAAADPRRLQQRAAPEPQEAATAGDAQADDSQEVPTARPYGDEALLQHPPALTAPIPQGPLWHGCPGRWLLPCLHHPLSWLLNTCLLCPHSPWSRASPLCWFYSVAGITK